MKAALRLLYPPQCLSCGDPVANGQAQLCTKCWPEAKFIQGCACNSCGAPLPGQTDTDVICDDCLAIPRPWHAGRAAMVYGGTGRQLILALKHGDRPDLAPHLGRWLAEAAAPLTTGDTIVAPVPLHLRRLLERKYNQAALLADHVARRHRLLHIPDLLLRGRHTPAQDHRGVLDRFANIAGALQINPRCAGRIVGRPVLLIDDVMTSGATLAAATQVLQGVGAGPISVAVLARAVKDD